MIIPAADTPILGMPASHAFAPGPASPDVPGWLDLLDVFGDDFVRNPHPWLDLLRASAPVHHDPGTGGRPTVPRQIELAGLVGEFHTWLSATVRSGRPHPTL